MGLKTIFERKRKVSGFQVSFDRHTAPEGKSAGSAEHEQTIPRGSSLAPGFLSQINP
jgi:hypothetical protein